MYLDVNWKDGTVTHIPLAQSHTLQIISDGKVQDAFSFDGVASLTLNLDGAPAATDPVPAANEGAAEGPTAISNFSEPALLNEAPAAETPQSQPAELVKVEDPPASDPTPPAEPGSDTPSTSETAPTPPGDTPAPPADDHAAAVDAAATTVAAAQVIVAAPEIAPADKQVQIQTALGDIETALAQYPESAELLDAKAQLEALAGEITTA